MNQPIYELVIVNEIMEKMSHAKVDFYQRELSYSHCDVNYVLRTISFDQKNKDQKAKCCIESLPFCNGDYLVPLLKKLGEESSLYYDLALQSILNKFYIYCSTEVPISDESLLGNLFSYLKKYVDTYDENHRLLVDEDELQSILYSKVCIILKEYYEESEVKQKINRQRPDFRREVKNESTNI